MTPADTRLTERSRFLLLAAMALVVLPHAWHLHAWVSVFVLCVGLVYLRLLRRLRTEVPRMLLFALVFAGSGAVLYQYGTLLGRNAGVTLLVVMLALKLLEVKQRRDAVMIVFTSYFLVITNFLFIQTPLIAVYMFASTILITATLSAITHDSPGRPMRSHLQLAGTLLLQALPVMVVLFLLFPRIVGPIWGLPKDAHAGLTGLSGSMSPGAISQLVESEATAFRATFSGTAPAPEQRYWRGPVLWETDGRTWTTGGFIMHSPVLDNRRQPAGDPVVQEITLEPHNKRWLLGLDHPYDMSVRATHTVGSTWQSPQRITSRTRYTVTSYTESQTGSLNPILRKAALQLPDQLSPRLQELAHEWRDGATDREVIQQALEYFHNAPFIYTQSPPLLGTDPMDEFLFETRRGFCEHYAAAFVLLMRSAGIPARVVTGYQGGEYNTVGEYWRVRQSDAHAWAEVWLPDSGWERVDPTAAVAPERIEHALDLGGAASGEAARFLLLESGWLASSWRSLRYTLDSLNNSWNQWVLTYGPTRQRELLAALGVENAGWKDMILGLLIAISVILAGVAGWMFLRQPRPVDPVLHAWNSFCQRLGRMGMPRKPSEGPRDYVRRVVAFRPELASEVNPIADLYITLRYASPDNMAGLLSRLKHRIRQFTRHAHRPRK
jgi:transglutaminase-like putative cysteine protease